MHNTRKILRTFIASPSDLQEERKVVRDAVDEFNESWADEFGYQIKLVGWEETISSSGRPQDLINQGLDQCDLFIGMVWKRWGTPPDHDKEFSSGFQEEFERAKNRHEQSNNPEISLFFKRIPDASLEDPGDQLKQVLKFQDKIRAERKFYIQEFSTAAEMAKLARRCINAYVCRVKEVDISPELGEIKAKSAEPEPKQVKDGERTPEDSPLSAEGFTFLIDLVNRMDRENVMDDISASDVARFRLLANSISKPDNQGMDLGVHDINILFFAHDDGMKLGEREIYCLAKLGLQHLISENVPLWRWYSTLPDSRLNVALVSACIGVTDDEKVGAIRVLDALAYSLPIDSKNIKREKVLNIWFSETSSTHVRSAALDYLAKMGMAEDYSVAQKEYGKNNQETYHKALECMLAILLRTGQEGEAQQLTLQSQFESLDDNTLQAVLNGFENLETASLLIGLKHRNIQVRLQSLKVLQGRNAIDHNTAKQLCGDKDALIRNAAVRVLSELGKSLSQEEVNKILIRPQVHSGGGLLGMITAGISDEKGKEFFARYELEKLMELSDAELTEKIETNLAYDDAPYFARAKQYFAKYGGKLRYDVDDTFSAYFEERIRRMETTLRGNPGAGALIKRDRDIENFHRKKLTRQGLDILCRVGECRDLSRIRKSLMSDSTEASKLDAEYLAKHGEWVDIPLLAKADVLGSRDSRATSTDHESFQTEVAKAILNMSHGHDISELFSLEMSAIILKKIIGLYPDSEFSGISDGILLELLDNESAGIRKAASMKVVQAFPIERIKSILYSYINRDKSYYYNVIHWLDLGVSMPTDKAQKVVCAALNW